MFWLFVFVVSCLCYALYVQVLGVSGCFSVSGLTWNNKVPTDIERNNQNRSDVYMFLRVNSRDLLM